MAFQTTVVQQAPVIRPGSLVTAAPHSGTTAYVDPSQPANNPIKYGDPVFYREGLTTIPALPGIGGTEGAFTSLTVVGTGYGSGGTHIFAGIAAPIGESVLYGGTGGPLTNSNSIAPGEAFTVINLGEIGAVLGVNATGAYPPGSAVTINAAGKLTMSRPSDTNGFFLVGYTSYYGLTSTAVDQNIILVQMVGMHPRFSYNGT